MSFQANRRQSQPDDGGYALPIVIVVIAVGAMVAVALLGYAAALLKAGADDADSLRHLYAADAGIATMKERLKDGESTLLEPLMVDDIEVRVEVTPVSTPRAPLPTLTPPPIDPELPDPLEGPHEVIVKSVPPRSVLDVRWEYSTTTDRTMSSEYTPPSIKVYPPTEAEGTPIATSKPCADYPQDNESLGCQQVSYEVKDTRVDLTVDFDPGTVGGLSTLRGRPPTCPNKNGTTLCVSRTPDPAGADEDEGSAPLVALQEEYIVVSMAGTTTVTAYIHQIHQWCLDDSSNDLGVGRTYERCDDVKIRSWKPYPPD